jgi:hypothetical protein
LAADHAPDICSLQSGGRLREGIIPISLGLRATGRKRFEPIARARREAFDALRARLRDGGFRLRARLGSVWTKARAGPRRCGSANEF